LSDSSQQTTRGGPVRAVIEITTTLNSKGDRLS